MDQGRNLVHHSMLSEQFSIQPNQQNPNEDTHIITIIFNDYLVLFLYYYFRTSSFFLLQLISLIITVEHKLNQHKEKTYLAFRFQLMLNYVIFFITLKEKLFVLFVFIYYYESNGELSVHLNA